ncbi:alpha/beta hydrolase [Leptospira wolffii]|uniref:alpha/beta fold hydrolase n=1 Tax=Leptospira wolffii TaxID=409998 RepID=UPI0010835E83|nr:alpha/beta hydrolase [Leptospira wolffii]TGK64653.1 alpha/beta hydrolase [Leptospira wolffii]TGK72741.1 alpha/beta hydrolase [Leptospira wolffii]TGK76948.1 alpha/beta hydrolase [Leptospira wolffii]TGL26595.1 alpha/beta hydrolase [Leptospira wolffii]
MQIFRILIPIFLIGIGCTPYEEMSMSGEEALLRLKASGASYREFPIVPEDDSIHWIVQGCEEGSIRKVLVFVHGSPGNWANYLRYFEDPELQKKYCLLGMDRPGFGKSPKAIPDVNAQAEKLVTSLYSILGNEKKKNIILLGHSYGGPLAARMAVISPDRIRSLVLLAPAMNPETEEVRWYNRIAKIIGPLLGKDWKNSNEEMLPLKEQLTEIAPDWKKIQADTIVVQGEEDGLVSPENLEFVRKNFPPQRILKTYLLTGEGHFIPWKRFDLVKKILIEDLAP